MSHDAGMVGRLPPGSPTEGCPKHMLEDPVPYMWCAGEVHKEFNEGPSGLARDWGPWFPATAPEINTATIPANPRMIDISSSVNVREFSLRKLDHPLYVRVKVEVCLNHARAS